MLIYINACFQVDAEPEAVESPVKEPEAVEEPKVYEHICTF